MSRKKNKVYAIFYADTGNKEIVQTWDEAKQKIVGVPNLKKGFSSNSEAMKWFDSITEEDIQRALSY